MIAFFMIVMNIVFCGLQWCVAVTVTTEASVCLQTSVCVRRAGPDRPVRPVSVVWISSFMSVLEFLTSEC